MFEFLQTPGQWPMVWTFGQKEGQWKHGLAYGVQPYWNLGVQQNRKCQHLSEVASSRFKRWLEATSKYSMCPWRWPDGSRKWINNVHIGTSPSWTLHGHTTPVRTAVSVSQRLQTAMWQIPWWEGLHRSCQVRLTLPALRGYKWVLPGIDADPGLGFTYQGDINASNTMKEPEHKTCKSGQLTIISPYQGTHFTSQQWAESNSPQH